MLSYSESVINANMYYLTGFKAGDPFIFLKKIDEDPLIIINLMEFSRAKKEANVKDIRLYQDYDYVQIVKSASEPTLGTMKFIASVAKKNLGTDKPICVAPSFPVMLADVLRGEGLKIEPAFDVVKKARETKDAQEVEAIKRVQKTVEEATSKAIRLIADSEIGPTGKLLYRKDGKKKELTVGKVRSVFDHTFVDRGCVSEGETIIACGLGSAYPHFSGGRKEVLEANQPIVMDVFPKSVENRYFSDMSRTIVKGKASKTVKKMFEAVLQVRNVALDEIKAGVMGDRMQDLCFDLLEKAGYQTIRGGRRISKGYVHGLGHGVGLEVHEGPWMSETHKYPLEEHNVITVEPGLYDPDIGGVRIEDIVEVTKKGCNDLTRMDIYLEV
jgi:Xaa-Pro aminopeptidase